MIFLLRFDREERLTAIVADYREQASDSDDADYEDEDDDDDDDDDENDEIAEHYTEDDFYASSG